MNSEILDRLHELAKEQTIGDEQEAGEDVVVDDYAGGNVDDAYWKGCRDGKVQLARAILDKL